MRLQTDGIRHQNENNITNLQRDDDSIADSHENEKVLNLLRLTIGGRAKGYLRDGVMQLRVGDDAPITRPEGKEAAGSVSTLNALQNESCIEKDRKNLENLN